LTKYDSASAATIVRIPYVSTLKNQADFLYATVDVAIWSCAETGLGIAACSIATLRPLFRVFLGRQHLMGGTSTSPKYASSGFPGGARSNGYMKSAREREIALRSDMGTDRGVTTIIESGRDEETGKGPSHGVRRSDSRHNLGMHSGWRTSDESKRSLASASDDDTGVNWKGGITKTTISKQSIA